MLIFNLLIYEKVRSTYLYPKGKNYFYIFTQDLILGQLCVLRAVLRMLLKFQFCLEEILADVTHVRFILKFVINAQIKSQVNFTIYYILLTFPCIESMCFFKCGSCENATAVSEHSFIGHLNL